MHEAFRTAAELAPDRIEFTYRYAESFYDLEKPDWDGAFKAWGGPRGPGQVRPGAPDDAAALRRTFASGKASRSRPVRFWRRSRRLELKAFRSKSWLRDRRMAREK